MSFYLNKNPNSGGGGSGGTPTTVVNTVTSTSTSSALSANMGRVLNETILAHEKLVASEAVLGHVKIDGKTITIKDGVISSTGGSSSDSIVYRQAIIPATVIDQAQWKIPFTDYNYPDDLLIVTHNSTVVDTNNYSITQDADGVSWNVNIPLNPLYSRPINDNDVFVIMVKGGSGGSDTRDFVVDGTTIELDNGVLKAIGVQGLTTPIADINKWLSGTKENVQTQLNNINSILSTTVRGALEYMGAIPTYADLSEFIQEPKNGEVAVIVEDETKGNARTLYIYSAEKDDWQFIGSFEMADSFTKLTDTPNSYTNHAGKFVRVDSNSKGLEFVDIGAPPSPPSIGKFTTTIVNTPYKHYKPSIDLKDDDHVEVVYNGLVLREDVDWEPEVMIQGEGMVIKLLINQSDNDNQNNIYGTVYRGFGKIV